MNTVRGTKSLWAKLKYVTNLPMSFKNKIKKYKYVQLIIFTRKYNIFEDVCDHRKIWKKWGVFMQNNGSFLINLHSSQFVMNTLKIGCSSVL